MTVGPGEITPQKSALKGQRVLSSAPTSSAAPSFPGKGTSSLRGKVKSSSSNATPTVEVEIAGVSLRLKSSQDEASVLELAQFVSKKVNQALPHTRSGSVQIAALLTCLNLAEELQQMRKAMAQELERLEQRSRALHAQLESCPLPKSWTEISGE